MSLMKRIKTLALAVFGITLAAASAPVQAAGTLPLAMAQQMDINGQPVLCQVSFFVAGTPATLQNAYADFGLTQPLSNPIACDQTGRVPMFWLADGLIHVRMIDGNGLTIVDTTMQVLGPSSGGGGGGSTVDPTTIAAAGDLKWRLDKSPIAGWVRINGLTIGTTGSGATERANTDTQNLYVYVWNNFSSPSGNVICPVIGGLGASALADFNAGKQLTLQDGRARTLFALDDMGNSAFGGFTGVAFAQGDAITGGSRGGLNSTTLLLSQLPGGITSSNGSQNISVSGSNSFSASGVNTINSSGNNLISVGSSGLFLQGGATDNFSSIAGSGQFDNLSKQTVSSTGTNTISVTSSPNIVVNGSVSINSSGANSISVTSNNTGGLPFPSVSRMLLGTLFWKL
jgi:hypothetical protein